MGCHSVWVKDRAQKGLSLVSFLCSWVLIAWLEFRVHCRPWSASLVSLLYWANGEVPTMSIIMSWAWGEKEAGDPYTGSVYGGIMRGGGSDDHWFTSHHWQLTTYFISFVCNGPRVPFLHHFCFSTFSWDRQFIAVAATTTTHGSHILVCSSAPFPKCRTYITKTMGVSSPPGALNPFSSFLGFFLVVGTAIFQVTHASGPWHYFLNVWSTGDF